LGNPKLHVIPYTICHTLEAVLSLRDDYLDAGYEGIILRSLDGKHKDGRATVREGQFLRDKPVEDREGELIAVLEAQKNLNEAYKNELGRTTRSSHKENLIGKGMVGALILRDLNTGMEVKVGPGTLSHNMRVQVWENQGDYLGRLVKYRVLAVGELNAPRQGRFWAWRGQEDMS
jgi:DNA ligase-1